MATGNAGIAVRPQLLASASAEYAKGIGGVHPHYQAILDVEGDATLSKDQIFPIIANLPERYHIDMSSSWSSPFAKNYVQGAAGAILGETGAALANAASQASGISTKLKSESVQVWEQSSPLSFSLDMIFVAKTNSIKDIRDKHRALLKLCAPSEAPWGKGQVLIQPGPVIFNSSVKSDTRRISLSIGNYLYLDNVVIKSVSSDVSTLCDKDGIPQHMVINVAIESFYACFTAQDIDKAFKIAGA